MESASLIQLISTIAFVVVVGFFLYQQWQVKKTLTVEDLAAAFAKAKPITEQVAAVAEAAVLANEQVKREGRLTNTEAFNRAFAVIRQKFPPASGVTDEEIIREINKYVLLASSVSAQIDSAKAVKATEPGQ